MIQREMYNYTKEILRECDLPIEELKKLNSPEEYTEYLGRLVDEGTEASRSIKSHRHGEKFQKVLRAFCETMKYLGPVYRERLKELENKKSEAEARFTRQFWEAA